MPGDLVAIVRGGTVYTVDTETYQALTSPTASVTQPAGDNSANIATTAFVKNQNYVTLAQVIAYLATLPPS
jgi:hypothetical protein